MKKEGECSPEAVVESLLDALHFVCCCCCCCTRIGERGTGALSSNSPISDGVSQCGWLIDRGHAEDGRVVAVLSATSHFSAHKEGFNGLGSSQLGGGTADTVCSRGRCLH